MKNNGCKKTKDPIVFHAWLRFVLAFVFLVFFACGNFFILSQKITKVEEVTSLIGFMESQCSVIRQATFSAAAYAQSKDPTERQMSRENTHEQLASLFFFGTTSNDIASGHTQLTLPITRILRKIYTSPPGFLNDRVSSYISVTRKFLLGAPSGLSSGNPFLVSLKNQSAELIGAMRTVIDSFQTTNEAAILRLRWIETVLFVADLACLALIAFFVVIPLLKRTGIYLLQMRTVNEALEIKVSERTAELEQKASELSQSNQFLREQMEERLKAERELLKTNAFLDSIIENIPNMIFIKDAEELRFVRFNRAGEELLGYRREELLGKNDYSFFPKAQADFFTQKDRNTLDGKELLDIPEEPIETRKKGPRILHTKKIPILDAKGNPSYLLGISEDVTDRIRFDQHLHELSMAMENALDGIAKLDQNMKFLSVNRAGAAMMGYTPQEMVGLNRLVTVCAEDHDKVRTAFEEMLKSGKAETEVKAIRKDGSVFYQFVVMVRTHDKKQNFTGLYCFMRDITEHKYREALEIKSELIQMVSHELRTPIHSIKDGISIVLEGLTGELTDEQREVLTISRRCVDRLVRLVNDVLAFHRFEAGVIEFVMKKTNLNKTIQEATDSMIPLAQDKDLSIDLELQKGLPEVEMDRDKILQVLTNFLQNSIKFTAKGGITITSSLEGKNVKVSIKDTGIGIQEKDFSRLFKKFGQAETAKLIAPGGTGLGLAISKKIIEEHRGTIKVESEYKKGSVFSFTLPLEQPKPASKQSSSVL
ncbi:MAG TPA: PAS domain-containing sensor histidine kinase [Candidatus Omnitrophota bacterium]|nr:PAS domain-containing sensor histidine kinase [Candidatus Omnitrophota bacterium]HPS36540.1 PAS domain-containing sensor histidine kinase [Candidatus Omnitrophota bacterium]